MTKNRKTAFLILRVDGDFKQKVVKKAEKLSESVSEFIRGALTKLL